MMAQKRSVITADDVRQASGRLIVLPNAIITPSARDLANELGVTLDQSVDPDADDTDIALSEPKSSEVSILVHRTSSQFAASIEHTALSPCVSSDNIVALCAEAREHRFAAVCVHPLYVAVAASELKSGDVAVCSVVGFPTGAHASAIKAAEARECVRAGARAIDMVANAGLLRSGAHRSYADDIAAVRHAIGSETILKVIIEAPLLDDADIVRAGVIAAEAGADYVKTSTGVYGQARLDDVTLLARVLDSRVQIKAAGGIRDAKAACAFLDAGASRIGTSSSVAIMWELGTRTVGA